MIDGRYYTVTERERACHWDPRFGYCVLWVYPPADVEGLHKDAAARARRARRGELTRRFWREEGRAPSVVLDGIDGVAMGPVEADNDNNHS